MSKCYTSFNVGRAVAVAAVSYLFIHAGAGTLTELALGWHHEGSSQLHRLSQLAVGIIQVVAVFGLFVATRARRMVAAMALALASLAPAIGIAADAVSGWCVAVTLL
ncbi:MAG TPA: hypothetical protein VIV60_07090, partial [Polyangiaceae bacterium]